MGTFEICLRCCSVFYMWSWCSQNEPIVIMMFPKRTNCDQDVLKTNQCDQNVPINHMVKTFSECHWGNFKCCINVPIGSRSNTWSGNIWNVPNLLSVGKWWVPSTRAYNVLKMFSLVSRPPCPQCLLDRSLCSTTHSAWPSTLLGRPLYSTAHSVQPSLLLGRLLYVASISPWRIGQRRRSMSGSRSGSLTGIRGKRGKRGGL